MSGSRAGRIKRGRPRRVLRRVERWAVGLAMAGIAFVLEKVVLRSVRKKGGADTG